MNQRGQLTVVSIQLNDGSNHFGPLVRYSYDIANKHLTGIAEMFFAQHGHSWNNLDLYVGGFDSSGRVRYLKFSPKGGGIFKSPRSVRASRLPKPAARRTFVTRAVPVTGGDYDGDGRIDGISVTPTNTPGTYNLTTTPSSTGKSTATPFQAAEMAPGFTPRILATWTVDYDGDGDTDLALVAAPPLLGSIARASIVVFHNNGQAQFPTAESFVVNATGQVGFGDGLTFFPSASLPFGKDVPTFVDLNGNGHAELIFAYTHVGGHPGLDNGYFYVSALELQ